MDMWITQALITDKPRFGQIQQILLVDSLVDIVDKMVNKFVELWKEQFWKDLGKHAE